MKLECSLCHGHLIIHCGNPDCDWWRCPTKGCDHEVYDVHRGLLLHKGGAVEVL